MTPAAKSQRAKRVAKEFATTWNLSEAGFNAKLEAGVFPAVDIESAAALEKTDEFFGGQKANQAMAQAARAGGPSRYAPNPQVEEKMLVATQSILGDGQPVEETLSTYHDQMVELVSEDAMEIEVDV